MRQESERDRQRIAYLEAQMLQFMAQYGHSSDGDSDGGGDGLHLHLHTYIFRVRCI